MDTYLHVNCINTNVTMYFNLQLHPSNLVAIFIGLLWQHCSLATLSLGEKGRIHSLNLGLNFVLDLFCLCD